MVLLLFLLFFPCVLCCFDVFGVLGSISLSHADLLLYLFVCLFLVRSIVYPSVPVPELAACPKTIPDPNAQGLPSFS